MSDNTRLLLDEQTLRERYALLCQVCDTTPQGADLQLEAQLLRLEQLIEHELPALARRGSPDNFADLLHALRQEMVRFREFFEYPELHSKVVVGLGGSFSAGKSSLINALIGDRKCLATELTPTTSLPTYLVQGEEVQVHAINHFNRKVSLTHAQFRTLTHEEKALYGSQVSALLKSVVVAHPALPWANLALLDTPGYSKADEASSERTDSNVARTQLNSAQFIVWLIPADKGTITEEDIAFLASLDLTIPKLVIISKGDKHPPEEIANIVQLVRETLAKRGLSVLDVLPFSNRSSAAYNAEPLLGYFAQWDKARRELGFAKQFKRQFMAYQSFIYANRLIAQLKQMNCDHYLDCMEYGNWRWVEEQKGSYDELENLKERLIVEQTHLVSLAEGLFIINQHFFTQLRQIGDRIGIYFSEPDMSSLQELKPINIANMLQLLAEQKVNSRERVPIQWSLLNTDFIVTECNFKALRERRDVAKQDETTRDLYAALLLMVLLNRGDLSGNQRCMLDCLISAIGLAGRQAELYAFVEQVSQEQLEEIILFLNKKNMLSSLLLDCMLFLRFDKPLTKNDIALLETIARLGGVSEDKIDCVICFAIFILGFPECLLDESECKTNFATYQFNIGYVYHFGVGVEKDYKEALARYTVSAELGCSDAQCKLGDIYKCGHGVPQNHDTAFYYYNNASLGGNLEGKFELALMYRDGLGVSKSDEKYIELMSSVAGLGFIKAMRYLGSIFCNGEMCQTNKVMSLKWNAKAAERGDVIPIVLMFESKIARDDWSSEELQEIYAWMSVAYYKYFHTSSWVGLSAYDHLDYIRRELSSDELHKAEFLAAEYLEKFK